MAAPAETNSETRDRLNMNIVDELDDALSKDGGGSAIEWFFTSIYVPNSRATVDNVLLVFPKTFEYECFTLEMAARARFDFEVDNLTSARRVTAQFPNSQPFAFTTLVADCTGKEFYEKIKSFLSSKPFKRVYLIGTAAAYQSQGFILNQSFQVDFVKNMKVTTDGSRVEEVSSKLFFRRPIKRDTEKQYIMSLGFEELVDFDLSTNYQWKNCRVIADMETFWFFKLCTEKAIPYFTAYRVVSDDPSIPSKAVGEIRKLCHFDQVADGILKGIMISVPSVNFPTTDNKSLKYVEQCLQHKKKGYKQLVNKLKKANDPVSMETSGESLLEYQTKYQKEYLNNLIGDINNINAFPKKFKTIT